MESVELKKTKSRNPSFGAIKTPKVAPIQPLSPKFTKRPNNHKNSLMKSALDHYYKTKNQSELFNIEEHTTPTASQYFNKEKFAQRINKMQQLSSDFRPKTLKSADFTDIWQLIKYYPNQSQLS